MRKFILFVLVVALLFGVSYYKHLRDQKQEQVAYAQGLEEGRAEIAENNRVIDSVTDLLTAEQARIDSIADHPSDFTAERDSLSALIISREATIERLNDLNTKLEAKLSSRPVESPEAKIVAYYNQRFQSLPGDLTEYERKVAVSEIRTETAQKFKISSDELDQIRKRYHLTD
jgi:MoxR-like ATPase